MKAEATVSHPTRQKTPSFKKSNYSSAENVEEEEERGNQQKAAKTLLWASMGDTRGDIECVFPCLSCLNSSLSLLISLLSIAALPLSPFSSSPTPAWPCAAVLLACIRSAAAPLVVGVISESETDYISVRPLEPAPGAPLYSIKCVVFQYVRGPAAPRWRFNIL